VVEDLLGSLVDKSLLATTRGPLGTRFRQLETLRQIADGRRGVPPRQDVEKVDLRPRVRGRPRRRPAGPRSANGEPSTGTTTRPMSTGSTGLRSVRSARTTCSFVLGLKGRPRRRTLEVGRARQHGRRLRPAYRWSTDGAPSRPAWRWSARLAAMAMASPDYDGRPALAGAIGRPEQEWHIRSIHPGAHRKTEARHASATDRRLRAWLGPRLPAHNDVDDTALRPAHDR
jgi:hypothetical protein